MPDRPMTNREHALLAYFSTIAFAPAVTSAKGPRAFALAIVGCLREDVPAALRQMAQQVAFLAEAKVRGKLDEAVGTIAKEVAGGVHGIVEDLFASFRRAVGG